jgi:hypothetical protein
MIENRSSDVIKALQRERVGKKSEKYWPFLFLVLLFQVQLEDPENYPFGVH